MGSINGSYRDSHAGPAFGSRPSVLNQDVGSVAAGSRRFPVSQSLIPPDLGGLSLADTGQSSSHHSKRSSREPPATHSHHGSHRSSSRHTGSESKRSSSRPPTARSSHHAHEGSSKHTSSGSKRSSSRPPTARSNHHTDEIFSQHTGSGSKRSSSRPPTARSNHTHESSSRHTSSGSKRSSSRPPTARSNDHSHRSSSKDTSSGSKRSSSRAPTEGSADTLATLRSPVVGSTKRKDWAPFLPPTSSVALPPTGSVALPPTGSVALPTTDLVRNQDPGRYNESNGGDVMIDDLENPFSQGSFRWVAKAQYTEGPRKGHICVCKWFKSDRDLDKTFFQMDIHAVDKAMFFIDKFNKAAVINKLIKINVPEVTTFQATRPDDPRTGPWTGRQCLLEPFITNYQKFNNNMGWKNESDVWGRVMQALSHFTFHESRGAYLLCDLQGGIYQNSIVLSDPVILSRTREFGVTDVGEKGILEFFCGHTCNEFCRKYWAVPQHIPPSRRGTVSTARGTAMEPLNVPTRHSKPAETFLPGRRALGS